MHTITTTITNRGSVVELKPTVYDLDTSDSTPINVDQIVHIGPRSKPLREAPLDQVVNTLKTVYCTNIAAQFMHLESTKEQLWIAKQLESSIAEVSMDTSEMKLANRLIQESEVFDHFLAKKFPGTKRYGLEGAESMIPAMHHLFQELNRSGTSDVVLGMPHRGRLVCLG